MIGLYGILRTSTQQFGVTKGLLYTLRLCVRYWDACAITSNTMNILCELNAQFVSVLPSALTENVIEYQSGFDAIG